MKHWYAVYSKPRQEALAEEHLQRQGYTTYLPKIRLNKRHRGKWTKLVEPLFPRYLFIHCDLYKDCTASVRSTRGVIGLVRIGHSLSPVPDEVIQFLKQGEDKNDQLRHDNSCPHQAGDRVRVQAGSFAGLEGVYQMPLRENRAMVLLELLGRENRVAVDLDSLSAT